jgi:hypothetical protein
VAARCGASANADLVVRHVAVAVTVEIAVLIGILQFVLIAQPVLILVLRPGRAAEGNQAGSQAGQPGGAGDDAPAGHDFR